MRHTPIVLITRPDPMGRAFAEALEKQSNHAFEPLFSPLLDIRFHPLTLDLSPGTIPIFTSRNGVTAWQRAGLPTQGLAYCVGTATAQAAAKLGFAAHDSQGTAETLIQDILQDAPKAPLLHIHGAHTRGNVAQNLGNAGLTATSCIAYDQTLLPLSREAHSALKGARPVIVPLFSPRSAAQFASQSPEEAHPIAIALSQAVADQAQVRHICANPSRHAMLEAVCKVIKEVATP